MNGVMLAHGCEISGRKMWGVGWGWGGEEEEKGRKWSRTGEYEERGKVRMYCILLARRFESGGLFD